MPDGPTNAQLHEVSNLLADIPEMRRSKESRDDFIDYLRKKMPNRLEDFRVTESMQRDCSAIIREISRDKRWVSHLIEAAGEWFDPEAMEVDYLVSCLRRIAGAPTLSRKALDDLLNIFRQTDALPDRLSLDKIYRMAMSSVAAPPESAGTRGYTLEMIKSLAEDLAKRKEPLFWFVELIAGYYGGQDLSPLAERLREWSDRYAGDVDVDMAAVREEIRKTGPLRRHLLVMIDPEESVGRVDNQRFFIKIWWYEDWIDLQDAHARGWRLPSEYAFPQRIETDEGKEFPEAEKASEPRPLSEIKEITGRLVGEEYARKPEAASAGTVIEFLVPDDLMAWDFTRWEACSNDPGVDRKPIGALLPILVRPLDRHRKAEESRRLHQEWARRWNTLIRIPSSVESIATFANGHPAPGPGAVGAVLVSRARADHSVHLKITVDEGLPFAVWPDASCDEDADIDRMRQVLMERELLELPDFICSMRNPNSVVTIPYLDWTLLWDIPRWIHRNGEIRYFKR